MAATAWGVPQASGMTGFRSQELLGRGLPSGWPSVCSVSPACCKCQSGAKTQDLEAPLRHRASVSALSRLLGTADTLDGHPGLLEGS